MCYICTFSISVLSSSCRISQSAFSIWCFVNSYHLSNFTYRPLNMNSLSAMSPSPYFIYVVGVIPMSFNTSCLFNLPIFLSVSCSQIVFNLFATDILLSLLNLHRLHSGFSVFHLCHFRVVDIVLFHLVIPRLIYLFILLREFAISSILLRYAIDVVFLHVR